MKTPIYIFLFFVVFGLWVPTTLEAHPGGTDSSGCHTCKTNCPNWGLSYGEYHCHNSKGYAQPEAPIRSHYGESGTGYTEPWPAYSNPSIQSYSAPSTPSCPIFSSYDSLSKSCKCSYGYVAKGGSCVSGNSICYAELGYNSRYSDSSNSCECSYGYVIGSSGQCVSQDNYCSDMHGYGAEYNILTDSCSCKTGYVVDSGTNSCVSGISYCQSNYGIYSSYDSYSKECECDYGYELRNGSCRIKEVEVEPRTPYIPSYTPPQTQSYTPPIQATPAIPSGVQIEKQEVQPSADIVIPKLNQSEDVSVAASTSGQRTPEETSQVKKSWIKRMFGFVWKF